MILAAFNGWATNIRKTFPKRELNRRHSNFFHLTHFLLVHKLNWISTNFIVNNHIEIFCYDLLNRNKRLRGLWNMNMKIWLSYYRYIYDQLLLGGQNYFLHPTTISVYLNIGSHFLQYSLYLKISILSLSKYHLLRPE